jgi:hypothetical protein
MKLTIEIELGNEAMRYGTDAANAIENKLEAMLLAVESQKVDGGKIMDTNGNSVGKWEFEP